MGVYESLARSAGRLLSQLRTAVVLAAAAAAAAPAADKRERERERDEQPKHTGHEDHNWYESIGLSDDDGEDDDDDEESCTEPVDGDGDDGDVAKRRESAAGYEKCNPNVKDHGKTSLSRETQQQRSGSGNRNRNWKFGEIKIQRKMLINIGGGLHGMFLHPYSTTGTTTGTAGDGDSDGDGGGERQQSAGAGATQKSWKWEYPAPFRENEDLNYYYYDCSAVTAMPQNNCLFVCLVICTVFLMCC
jgi:hypothetical protein